ncbi:MAG TPA: endoglucanase, partial [Clostridiales bacterium]|nr:endoglucanase [Clostridiales bacterium]
MSKRMIRIFCIMIVSTMMFSLIACSQSQEQPDVTTGSTTTAGVTTTKATTTTKAQTTTTKAETTAPVEV